MQVHGAKDLVPFIQSRLYHRPIPQDDAGVIHQAIDTSFTGLQALQRFEFPISHGYGTISHWLASRTSIFT